MNIAKYMTFKFPTSVVNLKNVKFFKGDDEVTIYANDDEDISFEVNNKLYLCSTIATNDDGEHLPYMACGDRGWKTDPDETEINEVEWEMHTDTIVSFGRDITKITFDAEMQFEESVPAEGEEPEEINKDIKLFTRVYEEDTPKEIGVFTETNGSYVIDLNAGKYIVVQKGDDIYYRPSGLLPRTNFPKIDTIPYMVYRNKAISTTALSGGYTAEVDGYVVMFSEGGTASNAGDGRSTTKFTAPRPPVFEYDVPSTNGTASTATWWYSSFIRVYYLYAGESVAINAQNTKGNSYTYLFAGIERLPYMDDRYNITLALKGWSSNNTQMTYNHKANPKDKYALWVHMTSGGNASAAAPNLNSSNNNYLLLPEVTNLFSFSTGGTAYLSTRFFKLPPDTDFTITGAGVTTSNTRCPCFCLLFTDKY